MAQHHYLRRMDEGQAVRTDPREPAPKAASRRHEHHGKGPADDAATVRPMTPRSCNYALTAAQINVLYQPACSRPVRSEYRKQRCRGSRPSAPAGRARRMSHGPVLPHNRGQLPYWWAPSIRQSTRGPVVEPCRPCSPGPVQRGRPRLDRAPGEAAARSEMLSMVLRWRDLSGYPRALKPDRGYGEFWSPTRVRSVNH